VICSPLSSMSRFYLTCWWPGWNFVRHRAQLAHCYSIGGSAGACEVCATPVDPGFWLAWPRFFLPLPRTSSTNDTPKLQLFNSESIQQSKMLRYTIEDNTNCFNTTNVINVSNYIVADDRSHLLTWLSPLDPGLRHWDIQERRAKDVGEWLIQTGEFRRWCGLSGEGEGDKAVMFCYGDPGVGKTFIR